MDSPSCRWSARRLELAQEVIVDALKRRPGEWVPRHEVRECARETIGDTGLLDFVLKSLGNRLVCGRVVRRVVNPATKVLEFSLEEIESDVGIVPVAADGESYFKKEEVAVKQPLFQMKLTVADIDNDLLYLFGQDLRLRGGVEQSHCADLCTLSRAIQVVLDIKQFMKDNDTSSPKSILGACDDDNILQLYCEVKLPDEDPVWAHGNPPLELVKLPVHATIADLKRAATEAFQRTYPVMRTFRVDTIVDVDGEDGDLLFGTFNSGAKVVVEGLGVNNQSDLRYQGGNENWIVDCPCGAKDDDGENMIACDNCEVWQHLRCGGIADISAAPHWFLCELCANQEEEDGSCLL